MPRHHDDSDHRERREEPDLYFVSYPPDGGPTPLEENTIILLHGLFGSHHEWDYVVPSLRAAGCRVLVPDLIGHGQSTAAHLLLATLNRQADAVARLLRSESPSRRVHVVGLSMGGGIAQRLVQRHPGLIASVFVSGAPPARCIDLWIVRNLDITWWAYKLLDALPDDVFWWLNTRGSGTPINEALVADMHENLQRKEEGRRIVRDFYRDVLEWNLDCVREVAETARREGLNILAVAGGLGDDVASTMEMGRVMRRVDRGNRAAVVRKVTHPWNTQFPDLFAGGVTAWIEMKTCQKRLSTWTSRSVLR